MDFKQLKAVKRRLLAERWKSINKTDLVGMTFFLAEVFLAWVTIFRHKTLLEFIIHRATRQEGWRAPIFRYYLRKGIALYREHGEDLEEVALDDLTYGFHGDPASAGKLERLLWLMCTKGYYVSQVQRMYHALWLTEDSYLQHMALRIYQALSEFTNVEIHPGARIGRKFWIDHAHGVVIGETAIVGEDNPDDPWAIMEAIVWLLHQVTLGGGSGPDVDGRRHPHVFPRVMIGAGARVIGALSVGIPWNGGVVVPNEDGFVTYVGAGATVRDDVHAGETFVGPKARRAGQVGDKLGPVRPADAA